MHISTILKGSLGIIIHERILDTYYQYMGYIYANNVMLVYSIISVYGSLRYLIYKDKSIEMFFLIMLCTINYNLIYKHKKILTALTWLSYNVNGTYLFNLSLNMNKIRKLTKNENPLIENLLIEKPTDECLDLLKKEILYYKNHLSLRSLRFFPSIEFIKINSGYYITMIICIFQFFIMSIPIKLNSKTLPYWNIILFTINIIFHTYVCFYGIIIFKLYSKAFNIFQSQDELILVKNQKIPIRKNIFIAIIGILFSIISNILVIISQILRLIKIFKSKNNKFKEEEVI